ncbi:MAG: hypothetical protein HY320_14985 [Armatimonadetes bacterium]|nr:hypothetical protein [Armatimonadota bacterium]
MLPKLIYRSLSATLLLGALLAPLPAAAQDSDETAVALKIGPVSCFMVRRPDGEWSAKQRVNHVQDVFAKHLGAAQGNFSTRRRGDRVNIFLNGDFVIGVTPVDAKATGFADAPSLAKIWIERLRKAFDETHVRPVPERER